MTDTATAELERRPLARAVRTAGEVVLLLLAFATVWPFGSVEAFWESVAIGGVALLVGLWLLHAGLTRRLKLRFDAPASLLSGLILLSGFQLLPLPDAVVRIVSPSTAHWHEKMLPETGELLPGETASTARPTRYPISLDPPATRLFASRMVALLAVYLAARNWLAGRESFRRLAWVALFHGVALAALALGQYFSSAPNVIYWNIPTSGQVFGPFVCRNHYSDAIALCAGLAIGIMVTKRSAPALGNTRDSRPGSIWGELQEMVTAPLHLLQEPGVLAAAAGVGLMFVSIPFSLSRGGMLSFLAATVGVFVLARWRRGMGENRTAVTVATAVGLCVVAGFGWAPLEKRFDELGSGRAIDDRTPLWKATFDQLPGFWLAGAGNGTHLRIEPLGRTETAGNSVVEHAHNEYLEAAIEGGAIRFGLTLAFPVAVLFSLARGYRRLHARSAGPLILGAGFSIAVVALHAVTDFALHLPAVALLAITVTAFALAAANDPEFQPTRQRPSAPDAKPRTPGAGWPAIAVVAGLFFLSLLMTWQARQRNLGDKYLVAGMSQPRSVNPEVARRRIAWLEASVAADPSNPDAFFQLAQAHLDAAHDLGPTPAEAVVGPVLPRRARADGYSLELVESHILPALRALRRARELCPLVVEVHARLGLLAGYFARSEPALVHLERAKAILKTDPDIWYACGVETAKTGDNAAAVAQWKKSLELSPKQLRPILREAKRTLPPEELLRTLLPDDPVILLGAADELYPKRSAQNSERRPFLERAARHPGATVAEWSAVAGACEELDRPADARRAWERAIELDRDRVASHEGLARLLEAEEHYAEALPQLEWLLSRRPNDADLRLRHKAAVHGAKLQLEIGE